MPYGLKLTLSVATALLLPMQTFAGQPHPRPEHTSFDTIQRSDIETYVNLIFSNENTGVFIHTGEYIHKYNQPINIELVWPECNKIAEREIYVLSNQTGIEINTTYDGENSLPLSMLIFGINSIEDFSHSKYWYDWLSSNAFHGEEDLLTKVKEHINHRYILNKEFYNTENHLIVFTTSIIIHGEAKDDKEGMSANPICKDAFPGYIFGYLANSTVWAKGGGISDIDYLYLSALYDPSIHAGESIETARPKLINLMLNNLERKR